MNRFPSSSSSGETIFAKKELFLKASMFMDFLFFFVPLGIVSGELDATEVAERSGTMNLMSLLGVARGF